MVAASMLTPAASWDVDRRLRSGVMDDISLTCLADLVRLTTLEPVAGDGHDPRQAPGLTPNSPGAVVSPLASPLL